MVHRLLIIFVASILLVACKGGGHSSGSAGPSPDAPTVSHLAITPINAEIAGRLVSWLIAATVTDPQNDLLGGKVQVRIVSTGEILSLTIGPKTIIGQTLLITMTLVLPVGKTDLELWVIDSGGHQSNIIPFFVTLRAAESFRGADVPNGSPGLKNAR